MTDTGESGATETSVPGDDWFPSIDEAIATGSNIVYLGHNYDATSILRLQSIADYLAAKHVWCPSIDEWWRTSVAQSANMDAYAGQILYVSDGTAGMLAVDVSDPLNPTQVGQIDDHWLGARRRVDGPVRGRRPRATPGSPS